MKKCFLLISLILFFCCAFSQTSSKLEGTIIFDGESKIENANLAFDNNPETYYASDAISHAWVGLDLGRPHIITKVAWRPRPSTYKYTMQISLNKQATSTARGYSRLAIFEGANNPDFSDAIPLFMVTSSSTTSSLKTAAVNVSRGFRYVRYVGPCGSSGNVGEIEFYGYEGDGDDTQFYQVSNLPLVVVHTKTGKDPEDKITNIDAQAYCIYTSRKGVSKIVGDSCKVRGRGNNSWQNDKKPMRIKFANKVEMPFGGSKAKKWTLISNFSDKTLMRNLLAFDLSHSLEMEYTPYCQPVDLIVNGEYKGNYQLCDQLEVSKKRINIDELAAEDLSEDLISGGYFFEYDGNFNFKTFADWKQLTEIDQAKFDIGLKTAMSNPVTIKSPNEDAIQQEQYDYFESYLNEVESQVYAKSLTLSNYIDVESFVRYFIVGEFTGNSDTFYETYQYKKRGDQKVYFGPCWDLDLGFSNDSRTYEYLADEGRSGWTFQNGGSCIEKYCNCGAMQSYAESILADDNVKQSLIENWAYVRASNKVSVARLLNLVSLLADSLQSSQTQNFVRWPILKTLINLNYQALGTYEKEVETIQKYIPTRLNWFDKQLELTSDTIFYTMEASEWATLYLPYAFTIPEGMSCFSVTGVDEESNLVLDTIYYTRPNTPYLVHAPVGEYKIPCYKVNAKDERENGLLVGCMEDKIAPIGSYVLQSLEEGLAFYRVVEGAQPIINGTKAYLQLPEMDWNIEKPAFYLDNNNDYIAEVKNNSTSMIRVFNLSGKLLLDLNRNITKQECLSLIKKLGPGIYIVYKDAISQTVTIK